LIHFYKRKMVENPYAKVYVAGDSRRKKGSILNEKLETIKSEIFKTESVEVDSLPPNLAVDGMNEIYLEAKIEPKIHIFDELSSPLPIANGSRKSYSKAKYSNPNEVWILKESGFVNKISSNRSKLTKSKSKKVKKRKIRLDKKEEVEPFDKTACGKYCCPHCTVVSKNHRYIRQHILGVHEGRRFKCDKCEHSSVRKCDLQAHKRIQHGNERFKCDMCEYSAKTKGNLKTHYLAIHTLARYICEDCGRKFTQPAALKTHFLAIHEGIKYECEICDVQTSTKHGLRRHMELKHLGLRFPCLLCKFETYRSDKLKTHMDSVHKGEN